MLDTYVEMELDDDVGFKKKEDGQIRCSFPSFVRFSEANEITKDLSQCRLEVQPS